MLLLISDLRKLHIGIYTLKIIPNDIKIRFETEDSEHIINVCVKK